MLRRLSFVVAWMKKRESKFTLRFASKPNRIKRGLDMKSQWNLCFMYFALCYLIRFMQLLSSRQVGFLIADACVKSIRVICFLGIIKYASDIVHLRPSRELMFHHKRFDNNKQLLLMIYVKIVWERKRIFCWENPLTLESKIFCLSYVFISTSPQSREGVPHKSEKSQKVVQK